MHIGSGFARVLQRGILLVGLCAGFLLIAGCGSGGSGGSQQGIGAVSNICLSQTGILTTPETTSTNTLPIYLGSAGDNSPNVCGQFINDPCTDVTLCTASGSDCQTINNVLIDTGSSGLRVFASVLSNTADFTVVGINGQPVGECAQFGIGSYGDWGYLVYAQVGLGKEPPVTVPIQIIDPTFAGQYTSSGTSSPSNTSCGSSFTPDTSPSQAGFNAILGVGLGVHWCGSTCATSTSPGYYFTCPSSSCSPSTLSLCSQDQNPVDSLPTDGNGVALDLPPISSSTNSLTGTLYIGIGTESNNTPAAGVTAYPATGPPNFVFDTTFNGTTYNADSYPKLAYIDSGSPEYYFTDSSIHTCSEFGSQFYCPSGEDTLSATIAGDNGSPVITVSFSVATPASGALIFDNIGSLGGGFDWGLPFFFGREVFVGINGKTSTLGTGPYWAF